MRLMCLPKGAPPVGLSGLCWTFSLGPFGTKMGTVSVDGAVGHWSAVDGTQFGGDQEVDFIGSVTPDPGQLDLDFSLSSTGGSHLWFTMGIAPLGSGDVLDVDYRPTQLQILFNSFGTVLTIAHPFTDAEPLHLRVVITGDTVDVKVWPQSAGIGSAVGLTSATPNSGQGIGDLFSIRPIILSGSGGMFDATFANLVINGLGTCGSGMVDSFARVLAATTDPPGPQQSFGCGTC